jgi:hypothetical protein
MTTKAAFTPEEWKVVLEGPPSAGMIVVTAARGGMFKETVAMSKAYVDARAQHGASELLDEVVAEKPKFDRKRFGSEAELRAKGEEQLAAASALLAAKATPEELEAYRGFVLSAAERVAAAHKENGEAISTEEQATLDEIRGHLGAA